MKKCFVCERELETDSHSVYGATIWHTSGNYGSTIYDPMMEDEYIEGYVCDECLRKKKALVTKVSFKREFVVLSREEPDFDVHDHSEREKPPQPHVSQGNDEEGRLD